MRSDRHPALGLAGALVAALLSASALSASPLVPQFEEEEEFPHEVLVLDAGGHTAMVRKVLFTPDGRQLISVADDKTVRVWDLATGEPVRVLHPPLGTGNAGKLFAAALSPDGKTLAVAGHGIRANPIYLITLADGQVTCLAGHRDVIQALAFSADGKRLASASADKRAAVWDPAEPARPVRWLAHEGTVHGVAFSPDGQRVATISANGLAQVWSVATGRSEAVLGGRVVPVGNSPPPSPPGPADRKNPPAAPPPVKEAAAFRGPVMSVADIAWSADGKTIATGGFGRSVRLWDPDGTLRRSIDGLDNQVTSLAFAPDGHAVLYTTGGGGGGKFTCALLDVSTGRELARFARHTNTVRSGAVSRDGRLAATGGAGDHGGEIFVWRTADGAVVQRLGGKGRSPYDVAWSRDGTTLVWDRSEAQPGRLFRPSELELAEVAVAPERGGFVGAQTSRGSVELRKAGTNAVAVVEDGKTRATLRLTKNNDLVRCYTFLGDDLAAVGGNFGRIYLFDTQTGRLVRNLKGHTSDLAALAPSPDGRYLLSAADQTLRVWTPQRVDPLLSLFVSGDDWIAWTPEGYYAASPSGEKLMGWHVNNGPDKMANFYPAAQFHKSLYRPDVVKLVLKAGSVEKALELAGGKRGGQGQRVKLPEVLPPRVAITSPAGSGLRLARAELEVKAGAESVGEHPVTALRLLVDARPYQGQAGLKRVASPRLGKVEEAWAVELSPGKHRLAVQADSAVSQAVSDEVEVVYVEESRPEVELPRLYVLAVGVSDYPGDLKLHYAASDAQSVAAAFQEKSKPLFRTVEVKLLTDRRATKQEILDGLDWLRQQMTQRDVAVVFFAGHGQKDGAGRLYFLPVDVNTERLRSTAVPGDELKDALQGVPGRVVALLDACHAGGAGGDPRRAAGFLTDDLVRDLVTDDYGVVVMASAMSREFALESNEYRHGYFTQAVVEGVSGKAAHGAEGAVYLHHLDAYVTDRVKELTHGQQHPVTAKPTSIRSFPLARP